MPHIPQSNEPKALQRYVWLLGILAGVLGGNAYSVYMDKGWNEEFIQSFFYTAAMLGLLLIVSGVAKTLEVLEKHAVNLRQWQILEGKVEE